MVSPSILPEAIFCIPQLLERPMVKLMLEAFSSKFPQKWMAKTFPPENTPAITAPIYMAKCDGEKSPSLLTPVCHEYPKTSP